MSKHSTVIGIDIGTESLRTHVFDLNGKVLVSASFPLQTKSPKPNHFEQSADEWWFGLKQTLSECLMQKQVSAESVIGIGFTGTSCTVLPVDEQGKPLRPALLWMDTRAHLEAEKITNLHHPAIEQASGYVSAEWMLPKALWLKNNEPDLWKKTYKLLEGPDYLIWKLSGEWTASSASAVGKRCWVWSMGGWPVDLFEQIEIPEFVKKNPTHILFAADIAGVLSDERAGELGLPKGITMVNCGPDAYTATIGSNSFSTGDFCLITGSSNVHLAPLDKRVSLPGMWGPWHGLHQPDRWTIEGGQMSTGSMLRWFVKEFASDLKTDPDVNVYELLNEQAESIAPGSNGLVLLDYWRGNRTPYNDPKATGVIWGLTLNHTRSHIYRALLEGVAYGTAHTISEFNKIGLGFKLITANGGATNSDLWMQIYADVSGIPVRTVEFSGATALGAAISCTVATGHFETLEDAAKQMVGIRNIFKPRSAYTTFYAEYFKQYIDTYPALKEKMHSISRYVEPEL